MTLPQLSDVRSQNPYRTVSFPAPQQGLSIGGTLANWSTQHTRGATWRTSSHLQAGRGASRVPSHRNVEMQWRRTHGDVLRRYLGQWVVLEGQRIVASGASLADAVRQARETGVRVPYVFRVEELNEDSATLGL